jgi:hypothetical protein
LLVDGSKGWLSYAPGAALGGLIIDGTVPKVNVLILQDNIINQNLLDAFMKRPNVRYKCAADGEEAVRGDRAVFNLCYGHPVAGHGQVGCY